MNCTCKTLLRCWRNHGGVQEKTAASQSLGQWTVAAPELGGRYSDVMALGAVPCSGKL